MKLRVRDVASTGLAFEQSVSAADIGLEDDFLDPDDPILVKGEFSRSDDFIVARVKVSCLFHDACARCLEPLVKRKEFDCSFEFELMKGDEYIDVGQRICEELILAHHPRVLCKDDCRGLCPDCGVDLNREECNCKVKN